MSIQWRIGVECWRLGAKWPQMGRSAPENHPADAALFHSAPASFRGVSFDRGFPGKRGSSEIGAGADPHDRQNLAVVHPLLRAGEAQFVRPALPAA